MCTFMKVADDILQSLAACFPLFCRGRATSSIAPGFRTPMEATPTVHQYTNLNNLSVDLEMEEKSHYFVVATMPIL